MDVRFRYYHFALPGCAFTLRLKLAGGALHLELAEVVIH